MYAAAFRNCLHVPSYWLCEPSAASGSSVRVPFRLSSRLRTRPNAWNQNGSTVCVTALRHHSFAMTCVALSHASRISRKTPGEIHARRDPLALVPGPLIYASRTAAKFDSAAVQDGYQLYDHAFLFSGAERSVSKVFRADAPCACARIRGDDGTRGHRHGRQQRPISSIPRDLCGQFVFVAYVNKGGSEDPPLP